MRSLDSLSTYADEETDLTETGRREIVTEAFHTFGEEAARELASHFAVPFDACRAKIAQLASCS